MQAYFRHGAKMPYKYRSKLKYLTALVINIYAFWNVTLCSPVRKYRLSYRRRLQSCMYVPNFLLSRSPVWYYVPTSLLSRSPVWYVCTEFPIVSVTSLVSMYRLSYCLGHQYGMYVPTFLLSRSPVWYVCTDFPIVSVTSPVRKCRLSYCRRLQPCMYVPTFLLSRSPVWYVRTDFPIVSVNSLVRMYRIPSPVMIMEKAGSAGNLVHNRTPCHMRDVSFYCVKFMYATLLFLLKGGVFNFNSRDTPPLKF